MKREQPRQRELDFSRLSRLRLVERVVLPDPPAATSVLACKSALAAVDALCGKRGAWTCAIAEIAQRMNCSYSCAKRALRQLRQWQLVRVERNLRPGRGWRENTYQVCWANLKAACEEPESYFAGPHSSSSSDREDGASGRECGGEAPVRGALPAKGDFWDGAMGHNAPSDGAQCSQRWGSVPHQEISLQELPQEKSPSSSTLVGAASPGGARPSPGWEEVEEEISRELGDWRRPLAACREAVAPAWVLAALAHYRRAGPGVYGPGALYFRILHAHPAVAPEDGWAPPAAPSGRVRRGLAELAQCRRLVSERRLVLREDEFWARFARVLAREDLADVLDEVRFRAGLERTAALTT